MLYSKTDTYVAAMPCLSFSEVALRRCQVSLAICSDVSPQIRTEQPEVWDHPDTPRGVRAELFAVLQRRGGVRTWPSGWAGLPS